MNNKLFIVLGITSLALIIPSNAYAEFDVTLPPPLQLTDAGFEPISLPNEQGTIVEATGINCKIKQTTEVYDQSGILIDDRDSGGIQGSPFTQLEFTFALMNEDIKHFQVIPKIFCSENSGLAIEVWIKQMTISTVADFEGTSQVVDTVNISQSPLLQFGSGQGEQQLANRVITSLDLEEHLPDRNLGVNWRFQVTGTINVAYTNFAQIVYQIPILWNELDTLFPTNVLKAPNEPDPIDSDRDGIIDSVDACPTQAEDFNGFEDTDGCPDIPPVVCPSGQVQVGNTCEIEPVVTVMPLDCEAGDLTTNDQITCMNKCLSDGNQWKIDTSTGKGFCTEIDPTCSCIIGESLTPEDFLTGTVTGLGRIVFKDLSEETFIIGDTGFATGAGNIQPLSVTVPRSGAEKEIERIEYEIHYRFPNTADGLATFLDDQDIIFTPTVEISSAESVVGTPRLGVTTDLGDNAELNSGVGFSILLSKGIFLSRDIQAIATQVDPVTGGSPPIGEGVAKDVKFIIDARGNFDFERESQIGQFTISEAFASFQPITIDNLKGAGTGGDFACPSGQIPVRDVDGQQIGCQVPPTNDRDGDGVLDNQDQCPDDVGTITTNGCPPSARPDDDDDGDGIPNSIDTDDDGDGIPDTEEEEGCQVVVVGIEKICVKGDIVVAGGNGKACSLSDPQNCPTAEIDFNTLLIVGGVAFIIIGVTVAVLRRR